MTIEAKVDNKPIKLIIDSGSAGSIVTTKLLEKLKRMTQRPANTEIITADGKCTTPLGEINDFPFEVENVSIPIKVLVIDAPQYQALVGNDWLKKAKAKLDWHGNYMTITYKGKEATTPITFEKKQRTEYDPHPPIIEYENFALTESGYQRRTRNNQRPNKWIRPRLECYECGKKLSSMSATINPKEKYGEEMAYYCNRCNNNCFGYLEQPAGTGLWDGTNCLLCGTLMSTKNDWEDIPSVGGVCDQDCKYAYLIRRWCIQGMPFQATFWRACDRMNLEPEENERV